MEALDRKILEEGKKEKKDRLGDGRELLRKLDEELDLMRRRLARDKSDKDVKI